jgi:hypothetical protein
MAGMPSEIKPCVRGGSGQGSMQQQGRGVEREPQRGQGF